VQPDCLGVTWHVGPLTRGAFGTPMGRSTRIGFLADTVEVHEGERQKRCTILGSSVLKNTKPRAL